MKTFKEFKNQFSNVDLGGKNIPEQIKMARNNTEPNC